jgi:Carboxypeptidase regulatory-like domain/TonB dependent receptor
LNRQNALPEEAELCRVHSLSHQHTWGNMKANLVLRLFLLLVSILASPVVRFPQDIRATLSGQITDAPGSAVPNAKVAVINTATNVASKATTNDVGRYVVSFLIPGRYRLEVEAKGFKKFVRENIQVEVGDRIGLDIRLQVGEITESVTVAGQIPLLETENASRGQVITSQQLGDLPNNGRNAFQLVWAVPGVIKTGGYWGSMENYALGNATGASINGGKRRENETLLDGATNTLGNRDVNFQPILDAVAEFKVNTGVYDAAYGRTGGGVTVLSTRSGSNAFHGSIWEYHKNAALAATPWVLNSLGENKPHFLNNTFGFQVGGPAYIPKVLDGRNKLFFMVAYEGLRERSSGGDSVIVPTASMRSGDFSGLPVALYDPLTTRAVNGQNVRDPFPGNRIPANRINPVAASLLKFVPLPNFGTGEYGNDNYAAFLGAKNGYNQWMTRVDYSIDAKNSVYFRYGRLPYTEFDGILFGGASPAEPSRQNPLLRNFSNWNADWATTLSPTTVFNLRFGLARYINRGGSPPAADFDPRELGFADSLVSQFRFLNFPRFTLGQYTAIGTDLVANKVVRDAYSYQANISKVMRTHQVKLGSEFRLYNQSVYTPGNASGAYSFSRAFTQRDPLRADAASGDDFASFLLGYPAGGNVDLNIDPGFQHRYHALFLQDDWKVNSRLSLNVGLRWDYESAPAERYNRMVQSFAFDQPHPLRQQVQGLNLKGGLIYAAGNSRRFFAADRNNFQPRVGAAFKLADRWVVRSGYGLYFLGADERGETYGYSRSTPLVASTDGGLTPRVTLANAFPEPLLQPVGSSQGLNTNLGLGINIGASSRPLPYSHQFSFGVQRQLGQNWLVEVSYVGNKSRRLPVSANVNVIPASELGKPAAYYTERVANPMAGRIPDNAARNGPTITRDILLTPYPHFGAINVSSIPIGRQNYHAMQSKLTKRFSSGMSFLLSYTISKNLEEVNFLNNQDFNLSDPDSSKLERRMFEFDVPQKLAVLWSYELPFGRDKRFGNGVTGPLHKIISGWQINVDATTQSGFPIDFPNAPNLEARSAKLTSSEVDLKKAYDPSLFPRTAPNLAITYRNWPTRFPDVRRYPLKNVDIGLFKNTRISERLTFQFRAEFLNAFNHPWFSNMDGNSTNVTNARFGWFVQEEGNQNRLIVMVGKFVW